MHRLLGLLLGVLFTVMIASQATAHVLEPIAAISAADAAASGHSAGDADEVGADADRNVPHHHAACHDHAVGLPVIAGGAPRAMPGASLPRAHRYAALATAGPSALLRPPRA